MIINGKSCVIFFVVVILQSQRFYQMLFGIVNSSVQMSHSGVSHLAYN